MTRLASLHAFWFNLKENLIALTHSEYRIYLSNTIPLLDLVSGAGFYKFRIQELKKVPFKRNGLPCCEDTFRKK